MEELRAEILISRIVMMSFGKLMRCCLKRHRSCTLDSYFLAQVVKWRALVGWHATPEVLDFDLVARVTSLGDRPIRLGAQVAGPVGLVGGRRTEAVVAGGVK